MCIVNPLTNAYDPRLDTGWNDVDSDALVTTLTHLDVLDFEPHRLDNAGEDDEVLVMSTLRNFTLRVGVFDGEAPCTNARGLEVTAILVYENYGKVQERSATHEPPLLGGHAVVQDGVASFKLRITVLSSLCGSNKFRVQVSVKDRPDLCVATPAVRTITKLRRGPKGGMLCASPLDSCDLQALEWDLQTFEEELQPLKKARTIDELWKQVHANSALLLELQKQQRELLTLLKANVGPSLPLREKN